MPISNIIKQVLTERLILETSIVFTEKGKWKKVCLWLHKPGFLILSMKVSVCKARVQKCILYLLLSIIVSSKCKVFPVVIQPIAGMVSPLDGEKWHKAFLSQKKQRFRYIKVFNVQSNSWENWSFDIKEQEGHPQKDIMFQGNMWKEVSHEKFPVHKVTNS